MAWFNHLMSDISIQNEDHWVTEQRYGHYFDHYKHPLFTEPLSNDASTDGEPFSLFVFFFLISKEI